MKQKWQEMVSVIIEKADQLLQDKQVHQGLGEIDYVTIFPKSEDEYGEFMGKLEKEGRLVRIASTGTVFQLRKPFQTPQGQIPLVRIRIYDPSKIQIGYVDYRIDDYQIFRKKYLLSNIVTATHNAEGVEMLMVENKDVIIYFPESPLGKTIEASSVFS